MEIICALCGKNQRVKVLYKETFTPRHKTPTIYSARRLPDRVHYRIIRCENCSLVFSSPIITKNEIKKLYRESICTYEEQIESLIKTYLSLFRKIKPKLRFDSKILEIGCGNGFFLDALKKEGYDNAYGVEPSKKMVSQSSGFLKKRIKQDVFKKSQFKKNSFDAVLSFHTLDHVVNPLEFVRNTYAILKKGGIALLVVHDVNGLSVKLFGERSAIFDVEHIYLFNKKTLPRIFIKAGFSLEGVEVFDVVNTYPFSYWLRMSGVPFVIQKVGEKVVRFCGIDSIPLSLNGGNIGIIARRP